jgi:hypothetical protein
MQNNKKILIISASILLIISAVTVSLYLVSRTKRSENNSPILSSTSLSSTNTFSTSSINIIQSDQPETCTTEKNDKQQKVEKCENKIVKEVFFDCVETKNCINNKNYSVKVFSQSYKIDKICELENEYVLVSGLSNSSFQESINSNNKPIDWFKKNLKSGYKKPTSLFNDYCENKINELPYEYVDSMYKEINQTISGKLFFKKANYSFHKGTAHPKFVFSTQNYDINKSKEIKLADITSDKNKLVQLIIKELKTNDKKEDLYPDFEKSVISLVEEKDGYKINFLVKDEYVEFLFNPYDVVPYDAGPISAIIQLADLK